MKFARPQALYGSKTCVDELRMKPTSKLRRLLPSICVIAIFSVGCRRGRTFATRSCDSAAPLGLTAERRDSLGPTINFEFDLGVNQATRPDAEWARLGRTVPGGFAGAYFEQVPMDPHGHPTRKRRVVVRLVHPDQRAAAIRALLPNLPAMYGELLLDSANVLVVPATWDFAQLDEWRRYLDTRVASLGIISEDTDEVSNQIRYGVADAATEQLYSAAFAIFGCPAVS